MNINFYLLFIINFFFFSFCPLFFIKYSLDFFLILQALKFIFSNNFNLIVILIKIKFNITNNSILRLTSLVEPLLLFFFIISFFFYLKEGNSLFIRLVASLIFFLNFSILKNSKVLTEHRKLQISHFMRNGIFPKAKNRSYLHSYIGKTLAVFGTEGYIRGTRLVGFTAASYGAYTYGYAVLYPNYFEPLLLRRGVNFLLNSNSFITGLESYRTFQLGLKLGVKFTTTSDVQGFLAKSISEGELTSMQTRNIQDGLSTGKLDTYTNECLMQLHRNRVNKEFTSLIEENTVQPSSS